MWWLWLAITVIRVCGKPLDLLILFVGDTFPLCKVSLQRDIYMSGYDEHNLAICVTV